MSKMWRVLWYEYKHHVFRRRFFVALLSVPLLIVAIFVVAIIASTSSIDYSPLGYVDQSGLLANPIKPDFSSADPFSKPVEIIAYDTEDAARQALDAGKIQAYYVLLPSYKEDAKTREVYHKRPAGDIQSQFIFFLRSNLLRSVPSDVAQRLSEGNHLTIETPDGARKMGESEWFNILVPLTTGILFMMVVIMSGGYLLQAVVDEKENRTMEIIVTSVSPSQLMTGKIIGNLAVGLTQIMAWALFAMLGILIGRSYFPVLRSLHFGGEYVLLMLVVMLPAFVLVAALMAALGATVTESREAQQISGLFTLPIMIPYWFTYQLMTNPNGPLAVGLSLFPLTAPVALTTRAAFTTIPAWQLLISVALLVVFAGGALWLAARTFRLGMLRYGKRLSLREIFGKAG